MMLLLADAASDDEAESLSSSVKTKLKYAVCYSRHVQRYGLKNQSWLTFGQCAAVNAGCKARAKHLAQALDGALHTTERWQQLQQGSIFGMLR